VSRTWSQLPRYKGTPQARLCRRGSAGVSIGALILTLAAGGCSYQLDSLTGKADGVTTGLSNTARQDAILPPEHDLAVARAAVDELLRRGGRDSSFPWENPRTGARGTITTVASAYSQNGRTCQDFLASYIRDGAESWMQGEACQINQGKWEVRNLKPWQRT
jgi:surface antigen